MAFESSVKPSRLVLPQSTDSLATSLKPGQPPSPTSAHYPFASRQREDPSKSSTVPQPPHRATSKHNLPTTITREPSRAEAAASPPQQAHSSKLEEDSPMSAGDRYDRLWAEMQAKLEEVELSNTPAARLNGPGAIFGSAHAQALEELRAAQLGLAHAWQRSDDDDKLDDEHEAAFGTSGSADIDVMLARKRREASEKHFGRVSVGVTDVVSRLDEVARAMGKVEKQSRGLWWGAESDTGSQSLEGERDETSGPDDGDTDGESLKANAKDTRKTSAQSSSDGASGDMDDEDDNVDNQPTNDHAVKHHVQADNSRPTSSRAT